MPQLAPMLRVTYIERSGFRNGRQLKYLLNGLSSRPLKLTAHHHVPHRSPWSGILCRFHHSRICNSGLVIIPREIDLLNRRRIKIGVVSGTASERLCAFKASQLRYLSRQAEERYTDDEYLSDDNKGTSPTYANVDDWKWKLNTLLRNAQEEEIISKEKKDRRDYEYLASLSKRLGLYSQNYGKVVAFSKVPLPNYRPDLDDKRPIRKVQIPSTVHNVVDRLLQEHFNRKKMFQRQLKEDSFEGKVGRIASVCSKDQPSSFPLENEQDDLSGSPVADDILFKRSMRLRNKQRAWQESPDGQKMNAFRMSLPAYNEKGTLLLAIANKQVLVVSGETGCGKTTQLPQYILETEIEAGRGAFCNIICTQPRRISAISVSERVAAERGEQLGESVGYKVRLEGTRGKDTRLLFCTTGILLRRLLVDPSLRGVSHVVVDEIHERGMNEDFLLIVLKDLLPRRPDLKLVLMSATLNAELFSSYFGGAPMRHIPGFTHPVESHFLEDILEATGHTLTEHNQIDNYGQDKMWKIQRQIQNRRRKNHVNNLVEDALVGANFQGFSGVTRYSLSQWSPEGLGFNLIQAVLCHICKKERDGAILVFMTGWEDINALKDQLKCHPLLGDVRKVLILPCHGAMASAEQKLIFGHPPPNVRKIVLATNMAETSITINDVVFVVDCGKAKETSYDALNNTPCLLPTWISKASARQRRGRAGRVQPGKCYHLYPRAVYDAFAEYQVPELLRMPLHSLCLQIKSLKLGSIAGFLSKALQPPEPLSVQNSIGLLKTIGVLDDNEDLTHLGQHLSMLPVEPRIGKMLIMGSIFGCLDPILTIAAGLTVRDPFMLPAEKRRIAEEARFRFGVNDSSDHMALVRAYDGWQKAMSEGTGSEYCWINFLSSQTLHEMHSLRKQFRSLLSESGFIDANIHTSNGYSQDRELLAGVICAGLFPGVASVLSTSRSTVFKTVEDGQVLLHQNSVLSKVGKIPYPWLAFNEKVKTGIVMIRDSTGVSDSMLLLFGGKVEPGAKPGRLLMQGGWLEFYMPPELAGTVLDLKEELDGLLRRKLENPRLDVYKECGHLITAVLEFLRGDRNLGTFAMVAPAKVGTSSPDLNDVKGLLQQRLLKNGYKPPVYLTRTLKNGTFQAKIEIRGLQFVGKQASSKKQAQKNAAADVLVWLDKGSSSEKHQDAFPTSVSRSLGHSKPEQQLTRKDTMPAKSVPNQKIVSAREFKERNVTSGSRLDVNSPQYVPGKQGRLSERDSTMALKTQIRQMIQGFRTAHQYTGR